jgi:hypothetical protein
MLSVDAIVAMARTRVRDSDADLMAVACLTGDPVAICAARETMALTARLVFAEPGQPAISWRVSDTVAAAGARFISALAECTGLALPAAEPRSALAYLEAARTADLDGRCIWVGDQVGQPFPFYHWYVGRPADGGVADFWAEGTWTTLDMRRIPADARPPSGSKVGQPPDPPSPPGRDPHPTGWLSRLRRRLT